MPIITPDTPLKEAVVAMSAGMLGHLLIAEDNKLVGLFSDGDLRRSLLKEDFDFNLPIAKYMTKEPYTIKDAKILAVEALKIIESKKIQLLIVVDEKNSVVGALHLHDLIEAGVENETK